MTERTPARQIERKQRIVPEYDRPFSSIVGLVQPFGKRGALELLASLQEGADIDQALAHIGISPSESSMVKHAKYTLAHSFTTSVVRDAQLLGNDELFNNQALGAATMAISQLPEDLVEITPILAACGTRVNTSVGEIDRNLLILDATQQQRLRGVVEVGTQPLDVSLRLLRGNGVLTLPSEIMRGRELRPATSQYYDQAALTTKGEQIAATMCAARRAYQELRNE